MNKKASYAFRILAGAYLIYLAYSLFKGYFVEHEASVFFVAAGVLFGALGLFFCVTGLLGRRKADLEFKREQEAQDSPLLPEKPDEASGEEPAKSPGETGPSQEEVPQEKDAEN